MEEEDSDSNIPDEEWKEPVKKYNNGKPPKAVKVQEFYTEDVDSEDKKDKKGKKKKWCHVHINFSLVPYHPLTFCLFLTSSIWNLNISTLYSQ